MRKTKRQRQSKRLNRKNKTFKKHKKGGQWFKSVFGNFGEKEPDNLNFRNAISEDDEGYQGFRENMNQLEKEKIERDKDYIGRLKFYRKNNKIQTLDQQDLDPENLPSIIPEQTAYMNKKQIAPTDEDRQPIFNKKKDIRPLRFGEDISISFENDSPPSLTRNVRVLKPGSYGGRKNTRKRKYVRK
jgi:hypothetical protein